ncbi:MAG: RNA polymerase sigma factor [Planctomycetota bacterium]
MTDFSKADEFLLDAIREGDGDAWAQLVDRYQGRLLAFARSRLKNAADAEDLVQDSFVAFLRAAGDFRREASLETYLFTILRRKIIDFLRGRKVSVCLIQDVMRSDPQEDSPRAFQNIASPEMTASWYARRDEAQHRQRTALTEALRETVRNLRDNLNFRDLKVIEMLFFCQLANRDVAPALGMTENQVALVKHRTLKAIRGRVARHLRGASVRDIPDALLSGVWLHQRLSCPKRSTIGQYLLGTLEEDWSDYVDFHINRLGCRFCQANLDDLKEKSASPDRMILRHRIMESSVGFFRQT